MQGTGDVATRNEELGVECVHTDSVSMASAHVVVTGGVTGVDPYALPDRFHKWRKTREIPVGVRLHCRAEFFDVGVACNAE